MARPKEPQFIGRQYVGQFNGRHGRTGALWESRYKACLVDSERQALTCYRYIELNPVRARITEDPAAWCWSSYAANLGLRPQSGLTPHPAWLALGATPADRVTAYRRLLDEALSEDTLADIRRYLQQRRAWGRDDFCTMVEARTPASPALGPPTGRPRPAHPTSEPDPLLRTPTPAAAGHWRNSLPNAPDFMIPMGRLQ